MLEIKKLNVSLEGKKLLKDISFKLNDKEIIFLSGHNGSGKTSLIQTIMGHSDYAVDSGDIILKETIQIGQYETTGEVWEKVSKVGSKLLINAAMDSLSHDKSKSLPNFLNISFQLVNLYFCIITLNLFFNSSLFSKVLLIFGISICINIL